MLGNQRLKPAHPGPRHDDRQAGQQQASFKSGSMDDTPAKAPAIRRDSGQASFNPVKAGVIARVPERCDERNQCEQADRVGRRDTTQPDKSGRNEQQAAGFKEKNLTCPVTQCAEWRSVSRFR